MKKIFTILACLMLITGCAPKNAVEPTENVQPTEAVTAESVTENSTEGIEETVQAVITMESGDTIKLELYPDVAPITVENFKTLAKDGLYDGLTFHRIISGFMIQGGCPKGNGTGGPGHNIKGEFLANGVVNNLKHTRGVISMARSQAYDSAGSQFFIMHEDSPWLDGQYAAFGKVVEGIEVVDKIASVQTDMYDAPLEKVVIETIAIVE